MVCMEECWPDLGGRVLAAPRGQPELLLLSGLSVTEVGIQGGWRPEIAVPSRVAGSHSNTHCCQGQELYQACF